MKISICIPTFGRRRMLVSALYSVLAQGYDDLELVVYDGDNGATRDDVTIARIFELVGTERLRYATGKNLGIFGGFNHCLGRATGEVLYCMGSDDLLVPGALSGVSLEFERDRYPTTFWLHGRVVSVDESGRRIGVDGVATSYDKMVRMNHIGLPSVFVGRGLFGLEGGFDTRYHYAADYELWLRLWRRREPLFLDQELGVYRHHDGQESRVHEKELEAEVIQMLTRHRTMLDVTRPARVKTLIQKAYASVDTPGSVN